MRHRILFFLIACGALTASADEWTIDPRVVPVPAGASEGMQASIEASPRPNPLAATATTPLANDAEWQAMIDGVDERRAAGIPAYLQEFPVKVSREEIAGVNVHRITPKSVAPANKDRLFLFFHGGAYVIGNEDSGIGEAIVIADRIRIPVISVDYRMPPTHPFPAAVLDTISVYEKILESYDSEAIIIGGTSAGGGLGLATIHKARELSLPMPAAVYAGTPWADLTKTGDTLFTNEGLDRVLVTYDGGLGAAARLYAGGHDMKDPLISPVYGDFSGFPPTILISGTRDMFLSDVARTHRHLRDAGVIADLHVYEGMSHAGYLVTLGTPESESAYREVGLFIDKHLR
jgi:monoterpene epsilon-lactone hydrolase